MFAKSGSLRFNRTAVRSMLASKARTRARVRLVLFLLSALLASVVVVKGYGAIRNAAARNDFFTVKTISITGLKTMDDARLRGLLTIVLSGNIFTRDIEKATLLLERIPRVESASIRLKLPDLAEVSVVERTPAIMIVANGKTYLMDLHRNVIEESRGVPGMAFITGWNGAVMPGQKIADERVGGAMEAAEMMTLDTFWHEKAAAVDLRDPARITVVTNSGVFLRFGPDKGKWKDKFYEYMSARRIAAFSGASFEGYDLSFENQVVGVNMVGNITKNQTNKIKG